MNASHSVNVLNRLLALEWRSLPMYLAEALPWTRGDEQQAIEVLENIVADQRKYAQRLAEMVVERDGRADYGTFSMDFADTNFLSLDFLLREVAQSRRKDIAEISRCVDQLAADRDARALAQEILGSARAHLEMIDSLVKQPAA